MSIKAILNIYNDNKGQADVKPKYTCKYCGKAFTKESSLAVHNCEKKRRHTQQNETGVQFGFKAYLRFYELTQGSSKQKTYDDFVASSYYIAFVKFGRYLVSIRVINAISFTDWLLKNNKKLDYWCSDRLYEEWLKDYLKKENPQDALERALKEMEEYANTHPECTNGFSDYFRLGNHNRLCQHIITGRISAWILFNCTSGVEFLDGLSEPQVAMIMPYIDPTAWAKKFADYPDDVKFVKEVLTAANL